MKPRGIINSGWLLWYSVKTSYISSTWILAFSKWTFNIFVSDNKDKLLKIIHSRKGVFPVYLSVIDYNLNNDTNLIVECKNNSVYNSINSDYKLYTKSQVKVAKSFYINDFIDELPVPFVHIIEETVKEAEKKSKKKKCC